MQILTSNDFVGLVPDTPFSAHWNVIGFKDGTISLLPKGFFTTWDGVEPNFGKCYIGKCSGFGIGSTVKYNDPNVMLKVGQYVSGGENVRFILDSMHNMSTISSYKFALMGLEQTKEMTLPDTVLENDIWIGDEAMILGGATIANGCIIGARSLIPPKKTLEPYGIYAGNPAKLIRFRFEDKIIELLLALKWWDKPKTWVAKHIKDFQVDLNQDTQRSIDLLQKLSAE